MKLFKDDPTFFIYKDIEKYSAKNKISFMQVKDILKGLVGDNLVETEKIGSSNYYWSLPTRVYQAKTNMNNRLEEQKDSVNNEIAKRITALIFFLKKLIILKIYLI